MSSGTATHGLTNVVTLADVISQLGDIPSDRIRFQPTPGTATEDDLIPLNERKLGLCELIDDTLVEKVAGLFESSIAGVLVEYVRRYLRTNRIGFVFPTDTMFRMVTGNVRLPDVSFVRRERFPSGKLSRIAIGDMPVDLAVKVRSISNTWKELDRKREELFASGTSLMWIVDPSTRTVRVYAGNDHFEELTENDVLTGGAVLPGFELSIREWFAEAESAEGNDVAAGE